MEPNLENIRTWAEALESDEFDQVVGMLRHSDGASDKPLGYCCLGVATELAIRAGVVVHYESTSLAHEDFPQHEHDLWCIRHHETLSKEVAQWLGIEDLNPSLYISGEDASVLRNDDYSASNLNDDGNTFIEIAYRIRRLWLNEPKRPGMISTDPADD
jgi:hypothetical protein